MECFFDGFLDIRRGEIIKILKAVPGTSTLRVSMLENISTNKIHKSRIEDLVMANPPHSLPEPIIGKVKSSEVGEYKTKFIIEKGKFEDHVFVKIGDTKKGRDLIIDIFENQIDKYVKICDPYLSKDTINLVSHIPTSIDILILTEKIFDLNQIKTEVSKLPNNIIIRKGSNLHDRFILTKGEGWTVGHSLKDFGKKLSQLSKMTSSLEAEGVFDENWNHAISI